MRRDSEGAGSPRDPAPSAVCKAAARYADQYDGYLVGNPGYRLPLAAIANMAGAQKYAALATNPADIGTGFTALPAAAISSM